MNKHNKSHAGGKFFQCDVCYKCFSTAGTLQSHKMIHKDKPLTCAICDKGFSGSGSLKRHQLTHSRGNSFQCSICSKFFHSADFVERHKLKTHPGEYPNRLNKSDKSRSKDRTSERQKGKQLFKCDDCLKWFSTKGNLQKHKMIHTGEKPFACKICHRCFNQAGSLKRHQLMHTEEMLFCCPDNSQSFCHADDLTHQMQETTLDQYGKFFDITESPVQSNTMYSEEAPFDQTDNCFTDLQGSNEECDDLFSISELLSGFRDEMHE